MDADRFRAALAAAVRDGGRTFDTLLGALDGTPPAQRVVPDMTLPVPMGDYVALRPVGRGAFGMVFEGRDLASGERVAIKVLHETEPSALESFKNEARLLVDNDHPALVAPDEIVDVGGRLALVMRFIDGTDFNTAFVDAAGERGPLKDEARCRRLVGRLFNAVRALHALGRLHVDLKPGNVLVAPDDEVLLVDFGVSRARRATFEQRLPGMAGTPFYLAPEQILGEPLGTPVDVYAAGVMLYEAFTGVGPFDGVDFDEVFARVHRDPRPLGERRPELPEVWLRLVDGMLTRDAAARPSLEALTEQLGADGVDVGQPRLDVFLGRDGELASLFAHWTRVVEGDGALAVITAEPGAGKTELASRFAAQVRGAGDATVVWGRCYERESIPYAAVDAVIDRLCGVVRADHGMRAQVRELSGFDALCRVFRVFGTVRDPEAPDLGPAASDDRTRAVEALQRVVDLLCAQRPMLVVIDDAQWGDADSVDVIVALLTRPGANRVFVLLTVRDGEWERSELGEALESRVRKGTSYAIERLTLGALPAHAVAEIVARRLGHDAADEAVARVVEASGGNLFVADQLVRDDPGVGGVDGMVRTRLSRWPADIQRLVRYAAVASAPVELAALVRAADVRFPDRQTMARLRGEGLLRRAVGPTRRAFTCYHDLVRETLLGELDDSARARAHRDLADALIAYDADPGTIARHRLAGGDAYGAATWALRGATDADEASAFARAADLYGLALEAGGPALPGRREVRERYAGALVEAGRGAEAADAFLSLAADTGSAVSSRAHQRRAAEALLIVGDVPRGLEVLGPILDELGLSGPASGPWGVVRTVGALLSTLIGGTRLASAPNPLADERAETCWVAAKGLVFVEPLTGLDFVARAARHGRRSGNPVQLARPLGLLAGFLLGTMPLLSGVADRWLAWIRERADAAGDDYLRAIHRLWASLVASQRGDLELGLARAREAGDLLAPLVGAAWERTQAASFVLRTLATRGELTPLLAMGGSLLRDAERRGDLYGQVLFSDYLMIPEVARGASHVAQHRIAWLETTWLPGRYTVQTFYATYHVAYADLAKGNPEDAARRLLADRPKFVKAGGGRIAQSRIDRAVLEARVGLSGVSAGAFGLPPVARVVEQLHREGTRGPRALAALLEACLWHQGSVTKDPERFKRAAQALDAAGLVMDAAVARLRESELTGDVEGQTMARTIIRRLGANDPDGWARVLAPV